ncbi:MAG: helix-turn-helix transcriptional regulator, partial [Rhizobiaceae bacterium]
MLSHERVWAAIDALAERYSLSASGLARRAGLDSTAFNKSKRLSADGRPRWPSTESLAKVIEATNSSLDEFVELVDGRVRGALPVQSPTVPLLGFAQAGAGGFFDDAGFPEGQGWDLVELPVQPGDGSYALKVHGDSMLPLYRNGDVLIVNPAASVRKGDRVVVKT